jgi:hypothetical protein
MWAINLASEQEIRVPGLTVVLYINDHGGTSQWQVMT